MHSKTSNALYWLCILSILVGVTALSGCHTPAPKHHLAYADGDFTVQIHGHYRRTATDGYQGHPAHVGESYTNRSTEVAATVTVRAPDGQGYRETSVTFSAPASLAGITVTRTPTNDGQEAVTVTCDGITVTHPEAFDRLLWMADAVLPLGDVTSVSPVTDGGYTLCLRTADGRETRTFACRDDIPYPTSVTYVHPDMEAELHLTFIP